MNGLGRAATFVVAGLLFLVLPLSPAQAQTNPALQTAISELVKSYLKTGGPPKSELSDGPSLGHWAVLKGVGLPQMMEQESLNTGDWNDLLAPIQRSLSSHGFSGLTPLKVLALFEETYNDDQRFVRLLGREGVIDPKVSSERRRGTELWSALRQIQPRTASARSNIRFADAGWQFTASAYVQPGTRLVRLAVSGSRPCQVTGSARTLQVNLKGRIFEDPTSPSGIKVQLLDNVFSNSSCELSLKDRSNSVQRLAGGGEAKVSTSLDILIRNQEVSGRFQVDLVSQQTGIALVTGRAVYRLRGNVTSSGELAIEMIPLSASGSRVLRQALEKPGKITGQVNNNVGRGAITIPVLKDALSWSDSRKR